MSKQANQKYRKERGLNHQERAKDVTNTNTTSTNSVKDMPSREGYGDGSPDGSNRNDSNKIR